MFRVLTRSKDDRVANGLVEIPNKPPPGSGWKPALRRIKKGLFPSIDQKHYSNSQEPEHSLSPRPLSDIESNSNHLGVSALGTSPVGESRTSRGAEVEDPAINQTRDRPQGPREPPQGFKLFKRSTSKRRVPENLKSYEEPQQDAAQRLQKERPTTASRPRTAIYVPLHTLSKDSPAEEHKANPASRPTSAYVLKHAASDFSKMNIGPNASPNSSHRKRRNPLPPSDPVSIRPTAFESNDNLTDYQKFLAESQLNQTQIYRSCRTNPQTPQASRLMDDITATHHANARRQSMSQSSIQSRPVSRGGSFMEKVGEYIKPSRPDSVYSQNTAFSSLDWDGMSFNGSVGSKYVPERPGSSWSKVKGSIRRSFSKDRGEVVDEGVWRRSWVDKGKRGGKVMPVSPGLKKYNKAVKAGEYWK